MESMRFTTVALVIGAVLGPVAVGFVGCGGNVAEVTTSSTGSTGSTGAGGTGGQGVTVSTATSAGTVMASTVTSSTASSSTTTSGGADGGTPCDQACAHASMCGLDVCQMLNVNCETVGTQYDCLFSCLDGVPCGQLNQQAALACYESCQATVPDSGVGEGGLDDGGTMTNMACEVCVGQSCTAQVGACAQDQASGCQGWFACTGGCYTQTPPDPTCFDNCDAQYPNAAAEYGAVYACACSSCNSECAGGDPCGHAGDGG
jgi:hypothetical protein